MTRRTQEMKQSGMAERHSREVRESRGGTARGTLERPRSPRRFDQLPAEEQARIRRLNGA